jgi:hypothetical protein
VTKIEMIFLYRWRVGVRWFEEGGLRQWCRFNASVSAREGRRRDEALQAEAASLSWLNGKEA